MRPSYLAKIDRAEQHLVELKREVERYTASHPYSVRTTGKGQRQKHWLRFTASPEDTSIGIIAADVIYNLRSGLDHLAAALVPANERDSVMFPILWWGVWDDPIPGENRERAKARSRWNTYTRKMWPEAVAHIASLQPCDDTGEGDANILRLVNRLSNTDRHSKLPVLSNCIQGAVIRWEMPNGHIYLGTDETTVKDDADIRVPKGAMDVEVQGTPLVVIDIIVRGHEGGLEIPSALETFVDVVRTEVVEPLLPHVRR